MGKKDRSAIPYDPDGIPPMGYLLAKDQDGKLLWVPPEQIRTGEAVSELTEEQVKRVKRLMEVFGEANGLTLQQALDSFRRDRDPEEEIRTWELMAKIYASELAERPGADAQEQKLLFEAILGSTFSPYLGDVLSNCPRAKRLRDLDRVVRRCREAMEERSSQ